MSSISLFDDDIEVVLPPKKAVICCTLDFATLVGGTTALERLSPLMSPRQRQAVEELMHGEEGQFYIDKMVELANLVDRMPVTYQQQKEKDPVAWLHYFYGGSDWYITEKDVDGEVEQAYGFACLNGDMMNAEFGYISISELTSLVLRFGMTVDLDFHFTPTAISIVRQGLEAKNGR